MLEQRRDEHRQVEAAAPVEDDRDVDCVLRRRRPPRQGARADVLELPLEARPHRRQPHAARALLLGGGDVRRGQLTPQAVHLVLWSARDDRAHHLAEPVVEAEPHRVERLVVDVDEPVEPDVGGVAGEEVDVDADRPHR